jgi:hypothetical protein
MKTSCWQKFFQTTMIESKPEHRRGGSSFRPITLLLLLGLALLSITHIPADTTAQAREITPRLPGEVLHTSHNAFLRCAGAAELICSRYSGRPQLVSFLAETGALVPKC